MNVWLEECWPLPSRVCSCERRVVEQLVDLHSRKPITIYAYAAVLWQAVTTPFGNKRNRDRGNAFVYRQGMIERAAGVPNFQR